MRKVLILMFMTLDGVAEYPDYVEDADSNSAGEGPPMWDSLMDSIDTLLLGRRTYEKWAGFWPGKKSDSSATAWMKKFSRFADEAEKVVFSKTLKSADWPNSRIVRGDIAQEVARLKAQPGKDMTVGGPRLAQSFLAADLADELLLDIFPSIVGRGKPLFRVVGDPDHDEDLVPLGAPGRHDFKLLECKPLKDGTAFLHYRRSK
ncbi:MAG: dihydrofolate reductase family protein [Thermoplasmata archaeon]